MSRNGSVVFPVSAQPESMKIDTDNVKSVLRNIISLFGLVLTRVY